MSKAILVMTAIATLGAIAMASIAGATGPATYNVPKQTAKLSVGLATAYQQCTAPTLSHRPALALPACPIESTTMGLDGNTNVFEFGPQNGSASLSVQGLKGDLRFQFKSRSILMNGTPYTSGGGPDPSLNRPLMTFVARMTDTGCVDGMSNPTVACTVVEMPVPMRLNCNVGFCHAAATSFNSLGINISPSFLHAGDTANIEVGQVSVTEPGFNTDTIFRSGLLVK